MNTSIQDRSIINIGIGWLVRRARSYLKISGPDLARILEISLRRLDRIESGVSCMTTSEWYLFCQTTQISPESIQARSLLWRQRPDQLEAEIKAAQTEVPEFYYTTSQNSGIQELKRPREILIVEDDAWIRGSLQELFDSFGFENGSAENGQAALDYLQWNEKPKLILMDWMMPVMSGRELLQELKDNSPIPTSIPVVVMTATPHLVKESPFGHLDIISKPFKIDTLFETAKKYCQLTQS